MKRLQGFSFVEIMIAVICLAVVLIPLTTMFSASSSGTVQNRNDILARQHAANLLDYCYSIGYGDEFLKPGNERAVAAVTVKAGADELVLDMDENFKRTIAIEEVKPTSWRYSYKLIKVRVSWFENKNLEKDIVMTGVVSDDSA